MSKVDTKYGQLIQAGAQKVLKEKVKNLENPNVHRLGANLNNWTLPSIYFH